MLSLTYTLGNIMLFYCINVQMCLLFLEPWWAFSSPRDLVFKHYSERVVPSGT